MKFKPGDKLFNPTERNNGRPIYVVSVEGDFYVLRWQFPSQQWYENSYHYRDIESHCYLLKNGVEYLLELV